MFNNPAAAFSGFYLSKDCDATLNYASYVDSNTGFPNWFKSFRWWSCSKCFKFYTTGASKTPDTPKDSD